MFVIDDIKKKANQKVHGMKENGYPSFFSLITQKHQL